jgi:hypothetical protein
VIVVGQVANLPRQDSILPHMAEPIADYAWVQSTPPYLSNLSIAPFSAASALGPAWEALGS